MIMCLLIVMLNLGCQSYSGYLTLSNVPCTLPVQNQLTKIYNCLSSLLCYLSVLSSMYVVFASCSRVGLIQTLWSYWYFV
jgi:hypothetical protein